MSPERRSRRRTRSGSSDPSQQKAPKATWPGSAPMNGTRSRARSVVIATRTTSEAGSQRTVATSLAAPRRKDASAITAPEDDLKAGQVGVRPAGARRQGPPLRTPEPRALQPGPRHSLNGANARRNVTASATPTTGNSQMASYHHSTSHHQGSGTDGAAVLGRPLLSHGTH